MTTALQLTVTEFDQLVHKGFFEKLRDRRVELIRGVVRQMSPPGPAHEEAVERVTEWSYEVTDRRSVRIRVQDTVGLPDFDSVPLPDVVWARQRSYRVRRPEVHDIFLIVEIADSSLKYDRSKKATLYAEAGIEDYWIVNLRENCLEILRDPHDGQYERHEVVSRGGTARPLAFPKLKLPVDRIFEVAVD